MRQLFGTDGIRGKANVYPMNIEVATKVGQAVVEVLKNKQNPKIIIGKDTRLSGYMFEHAITAGVTSMGGKAILVGPMPTPAIAHLTKSFNADAGIVISASHNPAEDNGIKIFDSNGFKLDDKIEEQIEEIILGKDLQLNKIGKAVRIKNASGRYIEFAKSSIKNYSLEGIKIVLDCANGAAYNIAPLVFSELGAEVIVLNNNPDGENINLNCGSEHPDIIRNAVIKNNANIGIALDGDADRVIVVDEKGEEVNGDKIMAISALELKRKGLLKNNTVVSTIMSNLGLKKCLQENGINLIQTQVGDRYVTEEMRKNKYIFGGEQSGHLIFLDYATTGDGIISALQLLKIMKKSGKKISELAEVMNTIPQYIKNVEVKEKKELNNLEITKQAISDVEKSLGANGRVIVRYSGTQNVARVMIEGEGDIESFANKIVNAIKEEVGV